MRRQKVQFLYVLFLCVAYINKSIYIYIYIYIYELAVEFCIFESSIIIKKKTCQTDSLLALFRDLTIYRLSSAVLTIFVNLKLNSNFELFSKKIK